jgi:IS4 transposase
MQSERIARITRQAFLKTPLFRGFTDIRKRPQIRLQAILMSLFAMPLFGIRCLLSNDREARSERYRALFGCRRAMVASDSTFARVLKWLDPQEGNRFLRSFLGPFEGRDLLRKRLSSTGRLRRLGILDGSYMGGHWLVTLCLAGRINYPVMVARCQSQGEELVVARRMMGEAVRELGPQRPELWLLDALYFNVNTIKIAREQKAHVLFKFKEADFRSVTADAQNLFQHFGGDEEATGWDEQRGCRWSVRKTSDDFGGYPVQVAELAEHYPKRKRDSNVSCWIVSTEMDLSLEELREAAHQRWQIENGIFKRISHLAGTKSFYFKDPRQFFNLLRLFYAAMAVLDSIMVGLCEHPRLFAALKVGMKATWRNVLSRLVEILYTLPAAFSTLT